VRLLHSPSTAPRCCASGRAASAAAAPRCATGPPAACTAARRRSSGESSGRCDPGRPARRLPASVAPSIFRDKNRRRIGKSQSKQQVAGRNGRRTGEVADAWRGRVLPVAAEVPVLVGQVCRRSPLARAQHDRAHATRDISPPPPAECGWRSQDAPTRTHTHTFTPHSAAAAAAVGTNAMVGAS
jgi:hypothetical protein